MDRKTILAVVISVVIIVGGMLLQSVLFPPKPAVPGTTQSSAPKPAATESGQGAQVTPAPRRSPPKRRFAAGARDHDGGEDSGRRRGKWSPFRSRPHPFRSPLR